MTVLFILITLVPLIAAGTLNITDNKRVARQDLNDLFDGYSSHFLPFTYYSQLTSDGNVHSRQLGMNMLNNLLFNNRFTSNANRLRPFGALLNSSPVSLNPNFPNLLTTFDSCTSPNGLSGVCAPSKVCSVFGGSPSGSCILGGVCCVNVLNSCSATTTLNNTYWQTPVPAPATPSTCALTVKLNTRYTEQKKPICQVRLDFISFTIASPSDLTTTARGVCDVDTFQASGAMNKVPLICGANARQHMYLHVPNSGETATDLQLIFNFGTGSTIARNWNIKVTMLPCGAEYLAPYDCLQYFTTATGTVSSFNFQDAAPESRQLANQDYNICFKDALINGQRVNTLCLDVCTLNTNGADPFRISGNAATSQKAETGFCANDFLVFVGASANNPAVQLDRLCGGALNTADAVPSVQVCSKAKPFRLYFKTDATEPTGNTGDNLNVGFCLSFQQRVV